MHYVCPCVSFELYVALFYEVQEMFSCLSVLLAASREVYDIFMVRKTSFKTQSPTTNIWPL